MVIVTKSPPRTGALPAALFAALLLGGCEGTAVLTTASLPTPVGLAATSGLFPHSTHEIYSRIARGAKTCWLGPGRPLELSHIFHAELAPEASGGAGEIAIHRRGSDPAGNNQPSNPRAGKVFMVAITRAGDSAAVVSENRHLPDTVAQSMKADVLRWARSGTVDCTDLALPAAVTGDAPPLPLRKPSHQTAGKRPLVKKAK